MSDVDLQADVQELTDVDAELAARGVRNYKPFAKQLLFHQSTARVRGLFTGNRFGKTDATVREALWWAYGEHPYRDIPEAPNFIRYYVDGRKGEHFLDTVLPKFRKYADPAKIGGQWDDVYVKGEYMLPLPTGSRIKFMSYNLTDSERSTQAYGGAGVDLHLFDEHGAFDIYLECGARLDPGVKPQIVVAYTPLIGRAAWEYREIYQRWERGEPGYDVVTGSIWDNEKLAKDPESIEEYLSSLPPEQRQIREHGIFADIGGLVYSDFRRETHFVPFNAKRVAHATKTVVIDPHPTFTKGHRVSWCGVDNDGGFVYRERIYRESIPGICDKVRAECAEEKALNEDIRRWVMDGAPMHWEKEISTSKSIAEQYQENGLPVIRASRDKMGGITEMQQWLEPSPTTGPRFVVMDTCPETCSEFESYSWMPQTAAMKVGDRWKTIDERDDFVTNCRYFVQTDPRYQGGVVAVVQSPGAGTRIYGNLTGVARKGMRMKGR